LDQLATQALGQLGHRSLGQGVGAHFVDRHRGLLCLGVCEASYARPLNIHSKQAQSGAAVVASLSSSSRAY
jgi:hypothetical protein